MEKQRIFWVILSVSVFVVVVLVVGVFVLRQKPTTVAVEPAGTVHTFSDPGSSLYEYGREPASGSPEVLNLVIGGEGTASGQPSAQQHPQPSSEPPGESQVATGTLPPEQPQQPAPPVAKPQPAPEQPRPRAAPAVAAKPAPAAPRVQYWIQTGSYRSQTRAEELAEDLTAKGLAGRVFSYRSGTDTFYRVRVGPYVNEKEAEKFLATVKQLQGLESSYISQVYRNTGAN
jgi:cell division protein FtsN